MMLADHDKTALIYRDEPISYTDLLTRVAAYASGYRIGKGDRVAICSENRPEWIYAFYSVWLNGGIPVPLDATAAPADLAVILDDSTPSAALCSSGCSRNVREAMTICRNAVPVLLFDDMPAPVPGSGRPVSGGEPGDTALILYTSGTTGAPKGVMLSFDNLAACIEGISTLGMLVPGDRLIGLLPFHHIFPLQGTVIAPLCIGSSVVIVASLSSDDILAALQRHQVTMFLGVPKLYELFHAGIMRKIRASPAVRLLFMLVRLAGSNRPGRIVFGRIHRAFGGHVRAYLTGGAPMDRLVARDLWALGFRLVEGYGLTETAPLVAFNHFDRIRPGTVGRPMAGIEVKIEDGEVLVRGRNVMKGYYKNPAATAEKVRDGWFHTGDLGEFDSHGYLRVTGRTDDMIVLPNGKNISPEEIERRLVESSPYIREAGVFLRGGRLAAVVLPDFSALENDGVTTIRETIRWKVIDRYNTQVPGYRRVMDLVICHEELPRTRLGKLKRYLLDDFAKGDRPAAGRRAEPATREYQIIKKFLGSLSRTDVRPEHHLELDLGLDSLNRVELMVFIESAFGVAIDEQELAHTQTVEQLAGLVAGRRTRMDDMAVGWREILGAPVPSTVRSRVNLLRCVRFIARPLFRAYFKLRYRGINHLPDGPFIIAPNHQSFMDVLLIAIALPDKVLHDTFFLARESLARRAPVRYLMKKANVVFLNFERDLRSALGNAASVLASGRNLVIFPEGHRSRDGSIGPFKKTFAILSAELGIPVVPVAISGAYDALPKNGLLPRPGTIELAFLEPVQARGADYDAMAEKIRSIINRAVVRSPAAPSGREE